MSMLKIVSRAGAGSENTIFWMVFFIAHFPAPDRQGVHSLGGFTHFKEDDALKNKLVSAPPKPRKRINFGRDKV